MKAFRNHFSSANSTAAAAGAAGWYNHVSMAGGWLGPLPIVLFDLFSRFILPVLLWNMIEWIEARGIEFPRILALSLPRSIADSLRLLGSRRILFYAMVIPIVFGVLLIPLSVMELLSWPFFFWFGVSSITLTKAVVLAFGLLIAGSLSIMVGMVGLFTVVLWDQRHRIIRSQLRRVGRFVPAGLSFLGGLLRS